jgi:hypothetical protein
LVLLRAKRYGFEFKYSDGPRATRSMHSAVRDLKLDHLWIVYPGVDAYPVHEQITAWPLRDMAGLVEQTRQPG